MWTGRQTLASIESAIAKLHGEESQLDGALRSAVGDAERLRKERSEALRELARIKLDEMAAGRLVDNLDAGERRAVQILDDYRMRIAAVTERREAPAEGGGGRRGRAPRRRRGRGGRAGGGREAARARPRPSVQATAEWRAAKTARRRGRCRRRRGREEGRTLRGRAGRQAEALRRRSAVRLPLAAPLRHRRLRAPATSRASSIAWSRTSSASAMCAPTTRR